MAWFSMLVYNEYILIFLVRAGKEQDGGNDDWPTYIWVDYMFPVPSSSSLLADVLIFKWHPISTDWGHMGLSSIGK
jgi:hypothetical protein